MSDTLLKKLARLAQDNPEMRPHLMPLIRAASSSYRPKDNWVLLDLAVQDAHKGKPDREWYRKDEGYTEVYDNTIRELKQQRRRATDDPAYSGNPDGKPIYDHKIDHGYDEPLAGGTDVMRRLQNQFRKEQGLPERPASPEIPKTAAGTKHQTSVLRKPYYAATDGVITLEDALGNDPVVHSDAKLKGLVRKLGATLDAVHAHLNANYLWD